MAVVFTMSQADIENSKKIAAILRGMTKTGESMVGAAQRRDSKEIIVENSGLADAKTPEAQNPVAPK